MSSVIDRNRKKLKLSQDELAKKLGVSRQHYNAVVNFRSTPSVKLAKQLAKILSVDWTIFFNNKVNK